jgi:TnpA family transposase
VLISLDDEDLARNDGGGAHCGWAPPHVTDQHTTYGTKVIVATRREAHYVLDEILGNATDIPITEHATDTHGVTLVNFALFDLLGLQL